MRNLALKGTYVLIFLLFFIIAWMIFTKVDVVVKAPGDILVSGYSKKVKSLQSGEIYKLNVKEGDFVKKGDLLLELFNEFKKKELNYTKQTYYLLEAIKYRILSELEGKTYIKFPSYIPDNIQYNQTKILINHLNDLNKSIESLNIQIEEINQNIKQLEYENDTNNKLLPIINLTKL